MSKNKTYWTVKRLWLAIDNDQLGLSELRDWEYDFELNEEERDNVCTVLEESGIGCYDIDDMPGHRG